MARPGIRTFEPPPPLQSGDRLFIRCEGGPCTSRLIEHPAPLEIEDSGGLYVLDDTGLQDDWVYLWVPTEM